MIVIGLRGSIGAGKTTISKILAQKTIITRYSFAQPIRDSLAVIGITKENNPEEYRHLAQYIGAYCRSKDPDHWVKLAKKFIANCKTDVVIDDVRYENELPLIDNLFHIKRTAVIDEIVKNPEIVKHESENMNTKYSEDNSLGMTIYNDEDIEDVVKRIIKISGI